MMIGVLDLEGMDRSRCLRTAPGQDQWEKDALLLHQMIEHRFVHQLQMIVQPERTTRPSGMPLLHATGQCNQLRQLGPQAAVIVTHQVLDQLRQRTFLPSG